MRRSVQLSLLALASSFAFTAVGCLADDDDGATSGDGGTTSGQDASTTGNQDASVTGNQDAAPGQDSGPLPDGSIAPDGGVPAGYGPGMLGGVNVQQAANADADPKYVTYRSLTGHPGCSTAAGPFGALPYTPAVIPGYTCAAQELGPADDPTKPIILLVHGNSSTPHDYQQCTVNPLYLGTTACNTVNYDMIGDQLAADGYHVILTDVRYDLVNDNTNGDNPALNYDHGWAVPIVQSMIQALVTDYPTRKINILGFSLGPTIIRDALRRLHRQGAIFPDANGHANSTGVYQHLNQLYFASGANHGVSTFELYCNSDFSAMNPTMAGLAACQLGSRSLYVESPFETPLNGPGGTGAADLTSWDTPCSDGSTAYGQTGVCGGTTVTYTTEVFADPANGPLQDEFVDQASAHLNGATNLTTTDIDPTDYFLSGSGKDGTTSETTEGGLYHHFGSIRGQDGVTQAVKALEKN
jgi:hypothetical protein